MQEGDLFSVASGLVFLGGGLIMQTFHKSIIRRLGTVLMVVGVIGVVVWFGYFRDAGAQSPPSTINQTTNGDCSPAIVGSNNTNNCESPPHVVASPQIQGRSNDPSAPWQTVFTVTVDKQIQTGDIKLACDAPCIKVGIGSLKDIPHAGLSTGSNGLLKGSANTVLYEISPLQLNPGARLLLGVFSKYPVHVISGSIGAYQITFDRQSK